MIATRTRTLKKEIIARFVADGRLRPIWRAAIYFAIGTWALSPLSDRLPPLLQHAFGTRAGIYGGQPCAR
jgi:hypothetical protein